MYSRAGVKGRRRRAAAMAEAAAISTFPPPQGRTASPALPFLPKGGRSSGGGRARGLPLPCRRHSGCRPPCTRCRPRTGTANDGSRALTGGRAAAVAPPTSRVGGLTAEAFPDCLSWAVARGLWRRGTARGRGGAEREGGFACRGRPTQAGRALTLGGRRQCSTTTTGRPPTDGPPHPTHNTTTTTTTSPPPPHHHHITITILPPHHHPTTTTNHALPPLSRR